MKDRDESDILKVAEAAKLLRIGRNQLYDAIARGEVPHFRVGKNIRLSRVALMRCLESCGQQVAKKGH